MRIVCDHPVASACAAAALYAIVTLYTFPEPLRMARSFHANRFNTVS